MSEYISLRFESRLRASRERVWQWITSIEGISRETQPIFRMTTPKGVKSLNDLKFEPGVPLFRSTILLFGILPIDHSDLTLLELEPGNGFVEQSPMGSMMLWRHERRIVDCDDDPGAVLLVDQLTFTPRRFRGLTAWFIRRVFEHRHRVIRTSMGGAEGGAAPFG